MFGFYRASLAKSYARAKTAKQRRSGSIELGAFATSQLQRKRQPKKTIKIDSQPKPRAWKQYRSNVPVMFTTNKKKPKKK
jgi:hypothetical protein